ncbi:MAG: DUF3883 domain-containing protein [Saprospiraceae bacterium]
MNLIKLEQYLENYKKNFEKVHKEEIYKWEAVKLFQENFDIETKDFYKNLEKSLAKTSNLLKSGNYYALKMLLDNARKSPEKVRKCFKELYDESLDIPSKIEKFRTDFTQISEANFPEENLNHYQDHRAIVVYLTLNYPERYFLYKFGMFKDFAKKIEYNYKPVGGRIENVTHFKELCKRVKYHISNDQELIRLHKKRLDKDCYFDRNLHILTQDFIYAVVRHLGDLEEANTFKVNEIKDSKQKHENQIVLAKSLEITENKVNFKPKMINFIENNVENKRIGDLGEEWVVKYEQEYLITNGKVKLMKKIKHASREKGDGLGYDILSCDLDGKPKFIEVKTTKGRANTTFYVTRNELERSKIEGKNYFLYRLYDFDEVNNHAKLLKIQGDLSNLCETPITYKVNIK